MPEWTAEVIWWICGVGVGALLLGWLVGRFGGGRVPRRDYELLADKERSIRHDLNDTSSRHGALETEMRDLRTQNLTLTGELEASQRILAETRDQIAAAPGADALELQGVNASLRDELEAARFRYAELHSLRNQMSVDLDDARGRLDGIDVERSQLDGELASEQARAEQLSDTNASLDADLAASRDRIEGIEKRSAEASEDLYLARAHLSEIEGKLAAALTALHAASAELSDVQDRVAATTLDPAQDPFADARHAGDGAEAEAEVLASFDDAAEATVATEVIDLRGDEIDITAAPTDDVDTTTVIDTTELEATTADSVEAAAAAADAAAEQVADSTEA